jgi:hypothetical protein
MKVITTRWVPRGFDALTVWPWIFIRPGALDRPGLMVHEMVHYREQREWWVLPWLAAYLCSRRFRIAAEVRAYQAQIDCGGISVEGAAECLTHYRTRISREEALRLFTDPQA